jgi:serine phosphatase RsbU (regulator of sigma subunit)
MGSFPWKPGTCPTSRYVIYRDLDRRHLDYQHPGRDLLCRFPIKPQSGSADNLGVHISEEIKSGSTSFWNSLLGSQKVKLSPVDPIRCEAPVLRHAEIAAAYAGMRMAGDFYEFLRVGPSRLLFVLLDIAGLRADTREILIAVQNTFRTRAPALFAGEDFNETTAMIALCNEMNLTILRGGVRSCPAFIGCYNEDLGTVCYANAGHTAGLLRDRSGITTLEATGLPLGLFSHATQSAAACHLMPGSALLVVSRGIVETDYHDPDQSDSNGLRQNELSQNEAGTEFGLDGAKACLLHAGPLSAYDLCLAMLQAARKFAPSAPTHNDLTTLALVRNAAPYVI